MKKKKKKIVHYNCPEGGCYDCKYCDIDKNGKIYCTLEQKAFQIQEFLRKTGRVII